MKTSEPSRSGKNILLVNTASSKKRFIIRRLSKLGLNITCLHSEVNWAQPYVDQWIIADTYNHNESIEAVEKFLKTNKKITKFDGILTFWEDDVLLTSKLVDKYNTIGIPLRVASQVRNKFLFREFCEANELPFARHFLITTDKDVDYVSNNLTFPLVLKPVFGSSSAFVIKVEDRKELEETYNYIKKNISAQTETALTDGEGIFAEEYLDGDEVDIDILVQNGKTKFITISDNYDKSRGSFFLDAGQAMPSSLPDKAQSELIEMVELVLEKLEIFNGCIHFEAKYTSKGPFPIEVNMRMGGDYVYSYNKTTWGVDLIEYAVKIALGEYFKINQKKTPKRYTIGWDLNPEYSGILTELEIDETLEKEKYFEDMDIYLELGDPILVPPEGHQALGWITVSGDNPLDVRDNLQRALEKISFKVVRYDSDSYMGKTLRKDKFSVATLNQQILMKESKLAKIKQIAKDDLKKLKIGILYNNYDKSVDPVEKQIYDSALDVENTLKSNGYNVNKFEVTNFCQTINDIKRQELDIILNLAKKVDTLSTNEQRIASLLDATGIPYTGSDNYAHTISTDKITFKKLLAYHNIPTPNWDYAFTEDDDIDEELEYPLIVKSANGDNSIGISNDSVVMDEVGLRREIAKIINQYKCPALIEEYIEGDEYSVVILGNNDNDYRILPLSRVVYDKLPKDMWHILSFDTKWNEKAKALKSIQFQNPPSKMNKKLEKLISEIALDTYTIIRCRDFGQVEIKVDKNGNPYILELNTNPVLSLDSTMMKSVQTMKMNHKELIEELIIIAINRYRK